MAQAGNMTLSKEEEEYINIITKYLVPVMFSLVILIGSIGNILVIYVVRLIPSETFCKEILFTNRQSTSFDIVMKYRWFGCHYLVW